MSVFSRRHPATIPPAPPGIEAATPRPWGVMPMGEGGLAVVKGAGGQSVCSLIAISDATLIVEAVNAHIDRRDLHVHKWPEADE